MGFSTIIDILGSTIVGGVLLLILFRVQDAATKNTYNYGDELIVQQNLTEVVQLLEYDFRKIGYCKDWKKIPDPTKSILEATANSIKFITDNNNDGIVDTIKYYLGNETELSSTPNPRDKMLYRVSNHDTPKSANLGVTKFQLNYYNALNNKLTFPIANMSDIYTLEIDINIESVQAYNNEYASVFWRQVRLAARNLRNR